MSDGESDELANIHPQLRSLALPIGELNEDPANANEHSAESLAGIAASFLKFGQRKPVVIRQEGMILEAGNGALAALSAAGWTHLACVVCDDDEGMAKAYALADNRTAQLATWNYTQLATNVQELLDDGFECEALGWSPDELQGVLGGEWSFNLPSESGEQAPGENADKPEEQPAAELRAEVITPEEPPIPEPPAEPITQLGDVIQLGPHTLHCADCMEFMAGMADNSIDAIITDPPYGLSPDGRARTWDDIEALRAEGKGPTKGFMGKSWDAGVPGITWARECLRILKPGGHIVAFSATRTVHRLACAIEDAGFEIRDQLGWLYWQGFPKSRRIDVDIDAIRGEVRETVKTPMGPTGNKYAKGLGDSRPWMEKASVAGFHVHAGPDPVSEDAKQWEGWGTALKPAIEPAVIARKPLSEKTVALNVLKWGTGAINIDAGRHAEGDKAWPGPYNVRKPGTGVRSPPSTALSGGVDGSLNISMSIPHPKGHWPANIYHCPKPATSEREAGCEDVDRKHETVKPRGLFAQLLRLFCPPGGVVYEPFGGSGTTVVAAAGLDCSVIVSEMEPGYCDIIRARTLHSLDPAAQRSTPARRVPARDGDKVQARRRVQTLMDSGALPAPGDVPCFDCGDTSCKSPHEYDHYLGYGTEHHESVQAVCARCHHLREGARVRAEREGQS